MFEMGVDLGDLAVKRRVEFEELSGKTVAIDAFNAIYQFLSIIRQRDGTPLLDSKGNVTSYLSGLFYRNIKMMEYGIQLVYVFDGKPPSWKEGTIKTRLETKEEARRKWESALKEGRLDEAKRYAQATSTLTHEMVEESKELLEAMGIPSVQAPGEGEAEAAYLVQAGKADYAASQDYDSLMFGAPFLLRNLTVSGKRRLPGRDRFADVFPELIDLNETLTTLGIDRKRLIWIGLLCGTDYNDGVKGIGPKKGLKLVKECGTLKELHERSKATEGLEYWEELEEFFLNPETSDAQIRFSNMNPDKVSEIMCNRHEFSIERIKGAMDAFIKMHEEKEGQSQLGRWF